MTIPRATARLQCHAGFTLDDATEQVPYLAELGISHIYASPLATARPGSNHGYDVIDHTTINPALGGRPALERLVQRLRAHGMGLILDIVPNHMATHADNHWWWSVWAEGAQSEYAHYFDIDWNSPDPDLNGKIQAPFLGKPYGQALAEGDIRLEYDTARNQFIIKAHDNPYPVAVGTLADADADAGTASARSTILATYDPATQAGQRHLHTLLEKQHYRLAWWRCAPEEINWRRFFEVSELVGVRVGQDDVFEAVHALTLDLYKCGLIDGVRIDHVDGLADPIAYCARLRSALEARSTQRPGALAGDIAYLIVEKILAQDERLDSRWQAHGTTGYDFMGQITALLHNGAAEPALTQLWQDVSGDPRAPAQTLLEARDLMLLRHFPVERNATRDALHRIARATIATRDTSRESIGRALDALLRVFPVYRTYAHAEGRAPEDAPRFAQTLARAHADLDLAAGDDGPVLDAVADWLGGQAPEDSPAPERERRLHAIRRFQQLTPPLAAKSLEDTTFYQYGRLLSTNDVGGEPELFALTVADFHQRNLWRSQHQPHTMLTTATHDHKRGEDVRARLAVLTEATPLWRDTILRIRVREGWDKDAAPAARDRYMLLQTLVGAWPYGLTADNADGLRVYAQRLDQWQSKALREAKLYTSWIAPRPDYERAASEYLYTLIQPGNPTLDELVMLTRKISPAGAVNSLSQMVLRLTVPGVPDLYQGCEGWDLSLVDPDNRRLVDFAWRQQTLTDTMPASPRSLLSTWTTSGIKLAILARCLRMRAAHSATFCHGDYVPLPVQGSRAAHVVAFLRQTEVDEVVVIVPRCVYEGIDHPILHNSLPLASAAFWGDTTVILPQKLAGWPRHDVVACIDRHMPVDGMLPVAAVLGDLPVAILTRTTD
jgi:(1->4)-alpha-D-glucan 1-alpha-D-glucosylmutase